VKYKGPTGAWNEVKSCLSQEPTSEHETQIPYKHQKVQKEAAAAEEEEEEEEEKELEIEAGFLYE
jgi:hypothetical protein